MKSFNRIKSRLIVSVLSFGALGAIPLTSAVAEDGSQRLREFHQKVKEQRIAAKPSVSSALSSGKKPEQIKGTSSSLKRFQKRHRYGFSKPNGR